MSTTRAAGHQEQREHLEEPAHGTVPVGAILNRRRYYAQHSPTLARTGPVATISPIPPGRSSRAAINRFHQWRVLGHELRSCRRRRSALITNAARLTRRWCPTPTWRCSTSSPTRSASPSEVFGSPPPMGVASSHTRGPDAPVAARAAAEGRPARRIGLVARRQLGGGTPGGTASGSRSFVCPTPAGAAPT